MVAYLGHEPGGHRIQLCPVRVPGEHLNNQGVALDLDDMANLPHQPPSLDEDKVVPMVGGPINDPGIIKAP